MNPILLDFYLYQIFSILNISKMKTVTLWPHFYPL